MRRTRTTALLTLALTACGPGPYTDDSSICTAALHAGRITRAGGVVAIEIAGGFPRYPGSQQHGVTSRAYGAWADSFAFP